MPEADVRHPRLFFTSLLNRIENQPENNPLISAVGNSDAQTDSSRDFLSLTDALPTFDKGCLCDTGVRAKVNSPSAFRTCFSGTKDLGFDSCLEVQFRSGKT